MIRLVICTAVLLPALCGLCATLATERSANLPDPAPDMPPTPLPVNPNATPATKQVLAAIYAIKRDGKILAAQHVREKITLYDAQSEYQHVYDVTGKYPAMLGVDFIYNPLAAVTKAIQHWEKGGLVTLTWHQSSPAVSYQGAWETIQTSMSDADFLQLVTPGTPLYATWLEHIDRMAEPLKTLQEKGVVVLWRPYHEMNGNWFWWGGKGTAFRQLWINMYERYTNHHHLNNLIWVFSPNQKCDLPETYFPGIQYVDIGGLDIYNDTRILEVAEQQRVKTLLADKPIAMAEAGLLPPVADMIAQSEYVWFMPWHSSWCDNTFYGLPGNNGPGNTAEILREYYADSSVVTLDELAPYLGTVERAGK